MKLFDIHLKVKISEVYLEQLLKDLGVSGEACFTRSSNDPDVIFIKKAYLDENSLPLSDLGKRPEQIKAEQILAEHDPVESYTAKDKAKRIQEAHDAMNSALYAALPQYFGTSDVVAAQAWESSWRLKKQYAADYVSDGLKVIHSSTSFQIPGEALDTEQKILDYFSELIEERVKPFDKFRDQKVDEFLLAKAQIENE